MRTTVMLDSDVAERVRREMRRSGRDRKSVVNDALRRHFSGTGKAARVSRFVVRPHTFGFKSGVDIDRINRLADELEALDTGRSLCK